MAAPSSGIRLRRVTDADFDEMVDFDGRMFGDMWNPDHLPAMRAVMDLDRFVVARDDTQLVGVAGSYELELTVPGLAVVKAGGVTWVAVAPTHRRRGILRQMMGWVHADIDERGEPIAMLTASEGGIYERFGYGIATQARVTQLDTRRASIRPELVPVAADGGSGVRLTDLSDPALAGIFDRYRRQRVGELRRTQPEFELRRVTSGSSATVALHDDGYAVWKMTANWQDGHPAHEMALQELIAVTPEAHAALWNTVLSVDLVASVRSGRAVASDDELPFMLTDQRLVRTTDLNDHAWLHLRDVGHALEQRTYQTDDAFLVEVSDMVGVDGPMRWKVSGSPDGAGVTSSRAGTRTRPDIVIDRASLGSMYLGGTRPSTLARARRLSAKNPDVLRRADSFFAAERIPHCMTGF
jgi:predicted acetyltransferase